MEDLYILILLIVGLIIYDGIKYIAVRVKRRFGENPPDAKYGRKR